MPDNYQTGARNVASGVLAVLAMSAALLPQGALAQSASADSSDTSTTLSEIVVTGTSIRGVAPVGSTLVPVDRVEMDASPALNTAELLQENPLVFNSGITATSRNGPGGSSNTTSGTAIGLRGLGPLATLTLIDGQRTVPNGTTASYIDPTSIPEIALQRVEIVPDGASAVYGSDAIGGVVNLILRRDFKGVEVQADYGIGRDYNENRVSVLAGNNWDSGKFTVALEQSYNSDIAGPNRDYFRSNLTPFGGTDYRVTQCSPGNITAAGKTYAIPVGGASPTNLVAGTLNKCDNLGQENILPSQRYFNVSATFDQDLGSQVRLFADVFATRRDEERFAAAPVQTLTVPASNAFFVAPAGLTPASESVQYSFGNDFGPVQETSAYSESAQIIAGAEARLPHDLKLTFTSDYGLDHDRSNAPGMTLNQSALTAALASGNPSTAFNPFGTSPNSAAVINSIFAYTTVNYGDTAQWSEDLKLDGPLLMLPGGEMRFAVGADYRHLALETGTYRGPPASIVQFQRDLDRNVESTYGELLIPILGEDFRLPAVRALDVDVAGRIEKYSDVGTTRNPKYGLNWTVVDGFVIHASYGTSFRAPTLTQIYPPAGGGLYVENFYDPKANSGAGGFVPGVDNFTTATSLKPETAKTYSTGADFKPTILPGADFSINYFNIKYDGQIVNFLNNTTILEQENLYSAYIVRNPSQQLLQSLVASAFSINGGNAASILNSKVLVYASSANLSITNTDGLDLGAGYTFPSSRIGDFRVTAEGTKVLNFDVSAAPGAALLNYVNTINHPLSFQGRATLDWSGFDFFSRVRVNYQDSYSNNLVTPAEEIGSYTTVDFDFGYVFSAPTVVQGLKLSLVVTDLFNSQPPFVNLAPVAAGGGGYDPQNASPIGRIFAFRFDKRF